MRVVVASSSEIARPLLESILKSPHQVLAALTMPDKPAGRGRDLKPNRFSLLCENLNVPLFKPTSQSELNQVVSHLNPDVVITIAYGRLIKPTELTIPKWGWLNIHFSLLPRWRGASPVQRAILNGDAETGVTIFQLDEGMDTGPIFLSRKELLNGDETTGALLHRLSEISAEMILDVLRDLERGIAPIPQSKSQYSLAPKLSKDEGKINWDKTATEIERHIRAMNPWPLSWSTVDDKRISILEAKVVGGSGQPGEIISTNPLTIACGEKSLEIHSLKPEGKSVMRASEWMRGARLGEGAFFR